MRIDDDERVYIFWDVIATADPTGGTVALEVTDVAGTPVNGSPVSMQWTNSPVQSGATWTGRTRTTKMFTGTSKTPQGTDIGLTKARYMGQPIVTMPDGQVIAGPQQPIDVG